MSSRTISRKEFHEAFNSSLSGLQKDPWMAGRVRNALREKNPAGKKKLSAAMIVIVLILLLAIAAVASGILFSPRASARALADQALYERYGLTYDMQSYFSVDSCENEDGSVTVSYEGIEDLAFVLGRYDVIVRNNTVPEVTWSRDGEDTSKGFASDAWGKDQLERMLKMNRETGTMAGFDPFIRMINMKNGIVEEEPESPGTPDAEAFEREAQEVRTQSRYSREEMRRMARDAVVQQYRLTREQADMLIFDEENEAASYKIIDGNPCYICCMFLIQHPDPDNPFGLTEPEEKDGTYYVDVNVVTGVIEDTDYLTGAGGNG